MTVLPFSEKEENKKVSQVSTCTAGGMFTRGRGGGCSHREDVHTGRMFTQGDVHTGGMFTQGDVHTEGMYRIYYVDAEVM